MSGRVGELSAKQAASLTQFRDRIGDILPELPAQHDHYLLRWLRARSFDVPKAEVMIRKHLDFRRNMKADTIISDWTPPEVITRYVSGGMCGYDKEGNPIWYDLVGPLDPKGLLMSASKQDFLRTKMRNMEMLQRECEKQSEKLGVNVEAITLIYDCEGLGFKHMWKPAIETYGEILTMFEDNYPEGLKRVFLIKAPKLFPMAYNLIKRFLCEETRRKLTVVGSNWQEVLREHVDAEQLPMVYGGTRTDPDGDPRCRTMINYGGTVPHSYYIQNSIKVQYDTTVSIGRGAVLQLDVHVSAPCSLLRWQFASDGADIGFGVFRRAAPGGQQEKTADVLAVLPSQRYNAHLVPEDNMITCPEAGVYVLSFDNSYSVLQSKRVSYTAEVLPPAVRPSVRPSP